MPRVGSPILFVSAWNDSGGGFVTRLLDGHPGLAVYPFELQLGTGLAPCGFDDWFPAKYRWPILPASPRDAFDVFANQELRAAMNTKDPGKFAGFEADVDLDAWRSAFEATIDESSGRGEVVSSWIRAFFASWRDGPDATDRMPVGHCPVLALDWDLLAADLPDARMVHVVRSPFAGFPDTVRRRPGMSAEGFAARWSLVNTVAALHAARRPDRFRVIRYEALLHDRAKAMASLAEWLGLDFDDTLLTPTWNGTELAGAGPFGGVPVNSAAHERANILALEAGAREILSIHTAAARALCSVDDVGADIGAGELRRSRRQRLVRAHRDEDGPDAAGIRDAGRLLGPVGRDRRRPARDPGVRTHARAARRQRRHAVAVGDGAPPSVGCIRRPCSRLARGEQHPEPEPDHVVRPALRQPIGSERSFPPTSSPTTRPVYLPSRTRVLPGTLYIHDVVISGGELYVTVTGHNFVARIRPDSGWERVWWPRALDEMGAEGFRSNWFQLNSLGLGPAGIDDAHLTAFSDETSGPKPWKAGYGPVGRGVVFSARSRDVVLRGLTCPHSATNHSGELWLCNSGFGQLGQVTGLGAGAAASSFATVATLRGFTRGLAFAGSHALVGMSKVIDRYEPYAPGLRAQDSRCGVAIVDVTTGAVEAQLWWPHGLQIYEVQVLPGVIRPTLPSTERVENPYLRFLG